MAAQRWLAHICTHPDCEYIVLDGARNLSMYLCFNRMHHAHGALPLRPCYVVLDSEQPSDEEAKELRERSAPHWRRPSQHFEGKPRQSLTLAEPGEDWPGWPNVDIREAMQTARTHNH